MEEEEREHHLLERWCILTTFTHLEKHFLQRVANRGLEVISIWCWAHGWRKSLRVEQLVYGVAKNFEKKI